MPCPDAAATTAVLCCAVLAFAVAPASVSSTVANPSARLSSTVARTQNSVATPHTNRVETPRWRSQPVRPVRAYEGFKQRC